MDRIYLSHGTFVYEVYPVSTVLFVSEVIWKDVSMSC